MQTRRAFMRQAAGVVAPVIAAAAAKGSGTIGLGLGNYGLKMFPTIEAIQFIGKVGYDSVELTMMDGYTTEASKVGPDERRKIRAALGDLGLALPEDPALQPFNLNITTSRGTTIEGTASPTKSKRLP